MLSRVSLAGFLVLTTACGQIDFAKTDTTADQPQSRVEAGPVHQHADAIGPGWRIRDNVFESVHEPLRIRPPAGWRLADESEHRVDGAPGGFGLIHDQRAIQLFFSRVGYTHPSPDEFANEWTADWLSDATATAPTMAAELDGMILSFIAKQQDDVEHLHAIPFIHGEPVVILAAYHATATREIVHADIRRALAAVEILDRDERAALRAELEQQYEVPGRLGRGWSLRSGIYRNFDLGLRFRIPSSTASVVVGRETIAHDFLVFVQDRGRNQSIALSAFEIESGSVDLLEVVKTSNKNVEASMGMRQLGEPTRERVGDADGYRTIVEHPEFELGQRTTWVIHRGHLIAYQITQGTHIAALSSELVLDAAAGIEVVADLDRTHVVGGRYFDLQGGYAVDPVLAGPPATDFIETENVDLSVTTWQAGDESVEVSVWSVTSAAKPISTHLRMRTRELDYEAAGRERSESNISTPAPGQQWSWMENNLNHTSVLMLHGNLIYELDVRSSDPRLFERVIASFELLD